MTVGELRKKLEIYKDDVEIFLHGYDDLTCSDSFNDMSVNQTWVRIGVTRKGYTYYTQHNWDSHKEHTVLVIE